MRAGAGGGSKSIGGFKMPKVKVPTNLKMSDFGLPNVDIDKIKVPDYSFKDIGMPDFDVDRDVKVPEVNLNDVGMGKFQNFKPNLPDIKMSDFDIPDISTWKPNLSNFNFSTFGIDLSSFKIGDMFDVDSVMKDALSKAEKMPGVGDVIGTGNVDLDSLSKNFDLNKYTSKINNINSIASKIGSDNDLNDLNGKFEDAYTYSKNSTGLPSLKDMENSFPSVENYLSSVDVGSISVDDVKAKFDFDSITRDLNKYKSQKVPSLETSFSQFF